MTACTATTKSTKSTVEAPASASILKDSAVNKVMDSAFNGPVMATIASNGIYAPGNAELSAIRVQYKEVTMDMLKEGYSIYTNGACVSCHNANGIYQYSATKWKLIIDDMAPRTQISAREKDAVYKYVLSIKAAQAK